MESIGKEGDYFTPLCKCHVVSCRLDLHSFYIELSEVFASTFFFVVCSSLIRVSPQFLCNEDLCIFSQL